MEWVRDELWRALDGYQGWPVDPRSLCSSCRGRVMELVLDPAAFDATRTEESRRFYPSFKRLLGRGGPHRG